MSRETDTDEPAPIFEGDLYQRDLSGNITHVNGVPVPTGKDAPGLVSKGLSWLLGDLYDDLPD